jgi:hypothetical protein
MWSRWCALRNRATLAVARKLVAYLLAVDRGRRPFKPAGDFSAVAQAAHAGEKTKIRSDPGWQVVQLGD